MPASRAARSIAALIGVVLLLAACVGTTAPSPSEPSETGAEPEVGSGAVDSLEGVETAVIQIEAEGSFVDPEFGEVQNAAGRGSGFIIDPSGIAVTNNHVVTGAALLQVWVGGNVDEPLNARVLAVSECSDLAVIDIEGDGYPYLEWYGGEITTGLDIYVAGFPLGDPEYTLTDGIVSKEDADGETNWASVDTVIEHSAATNPGNSGGPVVTADGEVVAVHYAGDPSVRQQFAIGRDEALEIIDQLRAGEAVTSIGVNGTAISDGADLSGIWVASVESGSPADDVGIQGGDIITQLEGLVLATDGTMSDYCDILRSHQPDDELAVQVLRFATDEVLEGRIPDRELEVATCFACLSEEGEEEVPTDTGEAYEYTTISDDSGVLVVDVPTTWTDQQGGPWDIEGETGVTITAAPDIDEWRDTWDVPGLFFAVSRLLVEQLDEEEILDENSFEGACTYEGRQPYEDPVFTGFFDLYTECGGTETAFLQVAATPADRSYIAFLQIQVVTEADLEAADRVLNTFNVVGELP